MATQSKGSGASAGRPAGTASKSEQALAQAPLLGLIFRLATPILIAQIINILYNIVDSIYVGNMAQNGQEALTALGVCSPLLLLVSAFSNLVGGGAAPLASIELGRGRRDEAQRYMGTGFSFLLLLSCLLTLLSLLFKEPVLRFFGASERIYPFAEQYYSIYVLGTVFVQLALGMNPFISAQGLARYAMASVLIGALTNIVLDPIFIYALDLGVRGAALATVLSQALSAIYVLLFLQSSKSRLHLSRQSLCPDLAKLRRLLALGVSSFTMTATESAIFIVFNTQLLRYGGDLYVGAMTILQRAMQILFIPNLGFSQGVQPIVSYNWGAGNYRRVARAVRQTLVLLCLWNLSFYVLICLGARPFARAFVNAPEIIDLVVQLLPTYLLLLPLFGIQTAAQMYFVGTGKAGLSLFVALLRKVVLLIPLAFILPHFNGVLGIIQAEPISDSVSILAASLLLFFGLRDCQRLERHELGP